jgi:hypothetical protein
MEKNEGVNRKILRILRYNLWKIFQISSSCQGSTPTWWNGRHDRLKICFLSRSIGSSPIVGRPLVIQPYDFPLY